MLGLGCGPGQWTSYLHSLGADVIGVDMVPEFIAHARATDPGLDIRQGSMTDVAEFDHKVVAACPWPAYVFAARLEGAGFSEVERLRRQAPDRPDRRYAAIAARAT